MQNPIAVWLLPTIKLVDEWRALEAALLILTVEECSASLQRNAVKSLLKAAERGTVNKHFEAKRLLVRSLFDIQYTRPSGVD